VIVIVTVLSEPSEGKKHSPQASAKHSGPDRREIATTLEDTKNKTEIEPARHKSKTSTENEKNGKMIVSSLDHLG